MMDVRPIRNDDDYRWALAEIEQYFDVEPTSGTPEADRFEVLADLIEAYEARQWPIDAPDPVDAILYRMEIGGLQAKDLAEVLGSKSRASEILHRKRTLTLEMARKLHDAWDIPAEILIRPYRLDAA
ncbi:MAG: XRE family transcriptional regulator [Devosia sp.]|uniref:helix-turn-helix domain-containing protein n=1 Tax=Devosia sp. TaxID=1871048 RepID=UPI001AC3147C|nr:XRE family transcriptional regulator [Devosia sp.]MBN9316259.1 XRE family transcriptional regulator [Devosia sp.]